MLQKNTFGQFFVWILCFVQKCHFDNFSIEKYQKRGVAVTLMLLSWLLRSDLANLSKSHPRDWLPASWGIPLWHHWRSKLYLQVPGKIKLGTYRTHTIITCGLYIFYIIFYCGSYCRVVSVTDNLCAKQGNSSIFGSKIHGLWLRGVSNQEQVIMAHIQ